MKDFLNNTILEAGKIALSFFHQRETLDISSKNTAKDIVTQADLEVEQFIRKTLLARTQEAGFWGEETERLRKGRLTWIVDPIDGTHSFVRGQYFWSISIALQQDEEIILGAVYAPLLNDLYIAEKGKGALKNGRPIQVSDIPHLDQAMVSTGFACLRDNIQDNNLPRFSRIAQATMGQRRFGSAAIDLCLVADGQVDAFWEQNLHMYDVAAGAIIAMEAGALITDEQGIKTINPEMIVASNGKIHQELLALF